jgi:hypothetical protein
MAGFISGGGIVSWNGIFLAPRSITFTSPQPETSTINSLYTGLGTAPLVVPTGDYTGGSISVEFTRDLGGVNMANFVGWSAVFTYSDANGYSLSLTNALLTQASEEVSTGALVTGTLEFQWTSFSGSPYQ